MANGDSANAAASSSTVSSSASTSWPRYDVFINHRGTDVKKTLASHLYRGLIDHGLRVFLDSEEMETGHNIRSQIEHAISVASVHIAILSPRYAESSWCLDELVDMINSGATILPVFYKVDPSVPLWTDKDGAYSKAMRELEQKMTHDSETGELKPRFSSDTIQKWREALSQVADLSGFVHRDEDDQGEFSHNVIQEVLKKVPRTPLSVAKYPTGLDLKLEEFENAVLSQQLETERSEARVVGIVGVGGVGKTTLAKAFFNLRRSDYSCSSFLVDVRENASKLSLTYLQNTLLEDLKPTEKNNKIKSSDEGLEKLKKDLSSCHALIVLDDVDHLDQLEAVLPIKKSLRSDSLILITSRDRHVLRTSEVLESSIYILDGMNTSHSKELFCRYAFHQDRLRISYDSLEPKVKEIFLDIVCFFLGERRDKAGRIWGEFGVQNLQDRCLLEVDSEYEIKMHDHIRDMGREIAKDGSLPHRLSYDDLFQLSSPVMTRIHGIEMVSSAYHCFSHSNHEHRNTVSSPPQRLDMKNLSSNLHGMENLRLLATEGDDLEDILRRVRPPHLKWFCWYECPHSSLPDWIPMEQLRVLEINGTSLNIPWPHQSQAVTLQLRQLNIFTPLSDIPKSIGQLKMLEWIEISDGLNPITLERLPDEFCHLHCLKHLALTNFSRMVSLPDSFGDLTNLQHIDLDGASSLQMLPNSFGNLTRLKRLFLSGCKNLTMSNRTLRNITALEYLDLSGCSQLKELPPQVVHQRSLQKLYLTKTNLKELPSCIGQLCSLECLQLGGDLLEALPLGLGDLKSLKSLSLRMCKELKCLPDSIGRLTQLTFLEIEGSGIEYLPQELLQMNNLEVLEVGNCPMAELPFKRNVERVRETLLSLEGEKSMFGLKDIYLSDTKIMEIFFEGLCPNLQNLSLRSCDELRQIGGLYGLPNLQNLSLRSCDELRQIGGLYGLPNLRELEITVAKVEELPSLRMLKLTRCKMLQSIQGLGLLTKLFALDVSECKKLKNIQGLGQLTELFRLDVSRCF